MSGDKDDLIILIDENGNEVEAEFIDSIEYRGKDYVILLPKDENEHAHEHAHTHVGDDCDCEEEVVILKVEKGADGEEDTFVSIEDDDEQDAVFELFTQRMEEAEYDEDDFDDDDPAPGRS